MNPSDCLASDAILSSGEVGAMRVMCLSVDSLLNSGLHLASSGGRSRSRSPSTPASMASVTKLS